MKSYMGNSTSFLGFFVSFFLLLQCSQQLSSQSQILQQLQRQLEYPKVLEVWNYTGDICFSPSSANLSITCEGNSVTEIKIMGDKFFKVSNYDGFSISGQTLSQTFNVDSLITTLTRLTDLKVLSLVSLGIWGPFPDKIRRLISLEFLNLSSNFLYGSIPPKISAMVLLQTLSIEWNFLNETIPDSFSPLTNLSILSLLNNRLKGTLPPSLFQIKTLTNLALAHNNLSGDLPDLSGLSRLELLDLRENKFNSKLPTMPKRLITVFLNNNLFKGEIPSQLGELVHLQRLDLSFNLLQGSLLSSLFNLPNISFLNLKSNVLSGSIPSGLTCSDKLVLIDISDNKLMGNLPPCLNSTVDKRIVKLGGNCLSIDIQNQHPSSHCKAYDIIKSKETRNGGKSGILFGIVGGLVLVLVLIVLIFLLLFRRYCPKGTSEQHLLTKQMPDSTATGFSSEILANARYISQSAKLVYQSSPNYRVFSIEELDEATKNFHESTLMGEGSFGKLYKGRLENGSYVAIRCLYLSKRYPIRNLKLRLDLLSKLRHPHLVCLLGHCIDDTLDDAIVNRVFLIYEYAHNGDLHSHLLENKPEKILKWSERLSILIGVAKAVHFLHTGIIPGFFCNHLKSKNILLDRHGIAKLSDYGLTIITEEIDKMAGKAESQRSPLREENPSKRQSTKPEDDVYRFGFILLETLVGASITEREDAFLLNEVGTSFSSKDGRTLMIDPFVLCTSSQESLSIVISITNKCISPDSSSWPSFEDVLWNLQYAAQVQATFDGDLRSEASQS